MSVENQPKHGPGPNLPSARGVKPVSPGGQTGHVKGHIETQDTHERASAEGGKRGIMEAIAHRAHVPHGTVHAVESVERGGLLLNRSLRLLSAGAESHHGQPHRGVWGRLEDSVVALGRWGKRRIERLPGFDRLLAPRPVRGVTQRVHQSKVVRLWGRTAQTMGGRIPAVGSVLGVAIAVTDAQRTQAVLANPHSERKARVLAISQGGLSVVSGVSGATALVAAAARLNLPIGVPMMLSVSALTGFGAFLLSLAQPSKPH